MSALTRVTRTSQNACTHSDARGGDIIENAVFAMHLIKVATFLNASNTCKQLEKINKEKEGILT